MHKDSTAQKRILDERFLATFSSGRTIDRSAFIDMIMNANIQPFEVIHDVVDIHGNAALVINLSSDRTTKYTWIAVKKEDQWRVISETFSNVASREQ